MRPGLLVVCVLTFVHYAAAQMRSPIIPLHAGAHGATATAVGAVVAAHMAMAAVGSIPFGRAADVVGRRPLLLGGMALGAVTSLLLPWAHDVWELVAVYGIAGIGIAAFSPSALSLVGDVAAAGKSGRAFAWYSTAHYGAIGIGPFLGGLLAEQWGHGAAFIGSAAAIVVAFVIGVATLPPHGRVAPPVARASWGAVTRNRSVWAGWVLAASGLFVQGIVFTFLPLLAEARGFGPASIGVFFLILGLANTVARIPAGWVIDRGGNRGVHAVGGIAVACVLTALIPRLQDHGVLLAVAALFGGVSGGAFVALGVALSVAAAPAMRGLVMGGYSTALYLGLGLGSLVTGPVIMRGGFESGFSIGAALGGLGAAAAAILYRAGDPHAVARDPAVDPAGERPHAR